MTEEWRPILGYEGRYEVSNLGRIKSLGRERRLFGDTMRHYCERVMALHNHNNGYRVIKLRKDGTHVKFFVHVLVARAFILNPEGKPVVNHIDCDKKNCCAANLEWMTFSENTRYYYAKRMELADVPF